MKPISITNAYINKDSYGNFSVAAQATLDGIDAITTPTVAASYRGKYGTFEITDSVTGLYGYTTDEGGTFTITDSAESGNVSMGAFDASGATTKVSLDASQLAKIETIKTGSGKDSVTVATSTSVDAGAGNDYIHIKQNTSASVVASVTVGAGADTVKIDAGEAGSGYNGYVEARVFGYDYADGDLIEWGSTDASTTVTYGGSENVETFTLTDKASGEYTKAIVTVESRDGVAELLLKDSASNTVHYANTRASNVDYTADTGVRFEAEATTETLNLTLAAGTNNTVTSLRTSEGTFNLNAADAAATVSVTSDKVDFTLGISKKSTVSIAAAAETLDSGDTLYLMDGGSITDISFTGTTLTDIKYGDSTVVSGAVQDTTKGNAGKLNYTNGTTSGVLAYGASDGNSATVVDYDSDVTYYTRATTLNVDVDEDVIINLDGATGVQYGSDITKITGVIGGLVAGRSGKDNDITIATEEGHSTEVYGGAGGNDTIRLGNEEDATNKVWYSLGDGKDSVTGYDKGNNSIYFHDAYAQTKLLSDALKVGSGSTTLTLTSSDVLTLDSDLRGKTLSFTDASDTTYKVAVADSAGDVTYDADTKIYKAAASGATLNVGGEETLCIYTGGSNDEYGYYDANFKVIDASDATGTVMLSGTNVAGFSITGGKGINQLYGGGDKSQTLVGTNSAVDVFWFGSGDGNDTATNAEATDGLNLYNVESIDNVKVTVGTNYFTVNVGSDNLKVTTGEAKATSVLQGFTFANQAGTLYTYDTTTKSFQQK